MEICSDGGRSLLRFAFEENVWASLHAIARTTTKLHAIVRCKNALFVSTRKWTLLAVTRKWTLLAVTGYVFEGAVTGCGCGAGVR